LYRPRLVIGQKRHDQNEFEPIPPVLERELHWSPAYLATVKEGMRRVICEPSGTGRLACLPEVVMAGKTGTAEFGPKGSGQQRGWMILFAPFDNPRYAVAMVIDETISSGGASAGPRIGKIMADIFAATSKDG
jgi:penicillin-binding protein 2